MAITRSSLLTLEAYAKVRKANQVEVIAHRKLRTVRLGEHLSVQFEDETTIRRQIQEMLHIEKIFDEAGIESEIEAYAPLVPDGTNWKATMLIEYPDPNERKRELVAPDRRRGPRLRRGRGTCPRLRDRRRGPRPRERREDLGRPLPALRARGGRRAARCAPARASGSAATTPTIRRTPTSRQETLASLAGDLR